MRVLVAGVIVTVVLAAVPFAHAAGDRVAPGVSVHGVPLRGSVLEVQALVGEVDPAWSRERVVVHDGSRARSLTRGDLGLGVDAGRTAALAARVGREGDALRRIADFYSGVIWGHALSPAVRTGAVPSSAVRVADPGHLRLADGRVEAQRPRAGLAVDTEALAPLAASRQEFALPLRSVPAPRALYALAYERVNAALGGHTLVVDGTELYLSAALAAPMVRIEESELGPVASIDRAAVRRYVDGFAAYVDAPARPARIGIGPDGRPALLDAGDPGRALDREITAERIADALFTPGAPILAAVTRTDAAFSGASAARWVASAAVLGEVTTAYDGAAVRAQNIRTAVRALDGTVVQAGEEFSFWDRIGEVSYRTGYVDAGAILGGASGVALAGGICQVSTTVFGAVYRAGMPILERHAHGYYITRYALGLDAAVFDPGADLRWRNDLPDTVVLRAIDRPGEATFQVWGIPTGRTVEIAVREHSLRSVWPGQPADPAFPPGYVELGRTTEATRTVRAADGTSRTDVLRSVYAPVWGGPAR